MAEAANSRGLAYPEASAEAEAEFLEATRLDATFEAPWFNLGLLYKRRRDWSNSARCSLRAAELNPVREQPAWWNLGIAATALRDWDTARRAWQNYGIPIPEGSGPVEADFGYCPVRVSPEGEAEVVWCRRIDPARAVIDSVPFPESGRRYGDIVLHDGAPNGERTAYGRVYPVFDELELWESSEVPTTVAELTCPVESDAAAIRERFEKVGLAAEDWTANVRLLCKACSEGRVHQQHDHDGGTGWRTKQKFGFAAEPNLVAELLDAWMNEGDGRDYAGLRRAL